MLTSVGGWGVLTADAIADTTLELAPLPDDLRVALDEKLPPLSKAREVYLVVDRISVSTRARRRALEAIESAWEEASGVCAFVPTEAEPSWYTRRPGCLKHGFFLTEELAPRMFSFNSLMGSCESCSGVGQRRRW